MDIMYRVATAVYLKDLVDQANLLISQGYTPLGGITAVSSTSEVSHRSRPSVRFTSQDYTVITFLQTFYKPQIKDLECQSQTWTVNR